MVAAWIANPAFVPDSWERESAFRGCVLLLWASSALFLFCWLYFLVGLRGPSSFF
jgi:hypothetical protein